MLGIEPRAVRFTWSVLLTIGAVAFVYETRHTLLIFLLAIFFAYLLSPVVALVDRFVTGQRSRGISLVIVYVALIAVLAVTLTTIGARASTEASNLIKSLPDLAKKAGQLSSLPLPPWLEFLRGKILDVVQEQLGSGLQAAVPTLSKAIGQLLAALSGVGFAILVPILGFFFLKDGPHFREALLEVANTPERKEFLDGLLTDIHRMLGHYVRALTLLSVAVFICYSAFFALMGVPYGSLLATIAALLEFIPVLGPAAAAVAACVVAGVTGFSGIGWMVLFFVAYRIFQDYVLSPQLMGSGLALHPLLVIFGALAGEQLAGVPGMLFAAPALAAVRLIYVRSRRQLA